MTCVPAGKSVSVIEKGLSPSVTWRSTRSLRFIGVSSLAVITGVNSDVVIYSIVNSLAELVEVNKVQISVNGKNSVKFMDTMSLSNPYERNLEIIK